MEMVGLVMVVVIIILGIVLYLAFSDKSPSLTGKAKDTQTYTSFLTALSETDVPSCGVAFSQVAGACLAGNPSLCDGKDPCVETQKAMREVLRHTLYRQGINYNLSLGKVENVSGCLANASEMYSPSIPVVYPGGGGSGKLTLSICP
jgi:hypothetical protein